MKKIIVGMLMVMLLLMIFSSLAAAEEMKDDWSDAKYDFSSIHRVLIYGIDADSQKTSISDITVKKIQDIYGKSAARPGYDVLDFIQVNRKISLQQHVDLDKLYIDDEAEAERIFSQNLTSFVDIYVKAVLKKYEVYSYQIPAHTDWETRESVDTYEDKDGNESTITHTYEVPVYVPASIGHTSCVRIRFDAYDAKTGKEIFSREEERMRGGTDGCEGMFERISNSYFNDLKHKMVNG